MQEPKNLGCIKILEPSHLDLVQIDYVSLEGVGGQKRYEANIDPNHCCYRQRTVFDQGSHYIRYGHDDVEPGG